MTFSRTDCSQAREAVSAELDGELPELEHERLTAHLRACPDCSAWAELVGDLTRRLREAPSEVPAPIFAVQRPRRRLKGAGSLAMASTVAAASVAALLALQPASLTPARSARGVAFFASGSTHLAPQERFERLADGFAATHVQVAQQGQFHPV